MGGDMTLEVEVAVMPRCLVDRIESVCVDEQAESESFLL